MKISSIFVAFSEKMNFQPKLSAGVINEHECRLALTASQQKRYHISVKISIFDDSFYKKMTAIGYFDAIDDQTIRIRKFFEEMGLERLLRSMRLKRFLRPRKSLHSHLGS